MKDQPLTPAEETLMRWLAKPAGTPPPVDTGLSPEELTREREASEALGALLRRHAAPPAEPPYPDFFNAQLMRRLREETTASASRTSRVAAWWREWWRSPWFSGLTAAAAAVLVMLAFTQTPPTTTPQGTRVVSLFSPEPNAKAIALESRELGAVIIEIEGLESYPDERHLVGLDPDEENGLVASLAR